MWMLFSVHVWLPLVCRAYMVLDTAPESCVLHGCCLINYLCVNLVDLSNSLEVHRQPCSKWDFTKCTRRYQNRCQRMQRPFCSGIFPSAIYLNLCIMLCSKEVDSKGICSGLFPSAVCKPNLYWVIIPDS